jgi:hypothetical protein
MVKVVAVAVVVVVVVAVARAEMHRRGTRVHKVKYHRNSPFTPLRNIPATLSLSLSPALSSRAILSSHVATEKSPVHLLRPVRENWSRARFHRATVAARGQRAASSSFLKFQSPTLEDIVFALRVYVRVHSHRDIIGRRAARARPLQGPRNLAGLIGHEGSLMAYAGSQPRTRRRRRRRRRASSRSRSRGPSSAASSRGSLLLCSPRRRLTRQCSRCQSYSSKRRAPTDADDESPPLPLWPKREPEAQVKPVIN